MSKKNFVQEFIDGAKESTDGIHAITVVEVDSGMNLGSYSDGTLDPEVASAYNVEVVKSKLKAVKALDLQDEKIDDILITLQKQSHLISVTDNGQHMIYLAADKSKSNLAMLRNLVRKGKAEIQAHL